MGLTVVVNSMTVSHKGSNGLSIAFPDVCKTPIVGVPVPIPYPNVAMSSDVTKGSKKVKCDGESVLLKSSEISRSMGDEAGVQMGIISNKQMGKGKFANYSFDVKVEGENVCRLADPTTQNRATINAAAFCHLQAPGMVTGENAAIIKDACKQVEKKTKSQKEGKDGSGGPKTSGIIPRHWAAMQKYMDEAVTRPFLIYFRKTSPDCAKWIEKNHEPKGHEWTDGVSLKAGDREKDLAPAMDAWVDGHPYAEEAEKMRADEILVEVLRGGRYLQRVIYRERLYGVVISMRADEKGRPVLGTKYWKDVVKPGTTLAEKKWMTADYDIMDIVKAYGECQRPTAEEFGRLRFELNNAMNWPGIQHPHQAAWNTTAEAETFKGKEHFSNLTAVDRWLTETAEAKREAKATPWWRPGTKKVYQAKVEATVRDVPKGNIAPGRDLKLIDDNLTILGPGGGLHLANAEDYWDALACCGCLEAAQPDKPVGTVTKQEFSEDGGEWKEKNEALAKPDWKKDGGGT